MEKIIKLFIQKIKNSRKETKTEDAISAYQKTTYSRLYSKEDMKREVIDKLEDQIKDSCKYSKTYMITATYSGYLEKSILPEVAEHFRDLSYHVDLLNSGSYTDINLLIINWQGLRAFKQ